MRTARLSTRSLLLAVLGVLTGCATPDRAPIRIGAWNIEWLGSPNRRSGPARGHAQTPEALADYILAANVDILGLEEVSRNAEDGSWTNDTLKQAFEIVERENGGDWRQRLYPSRSGRNQLCGIAWNAARVDALGEARKICAPDERSTQSKIVWSRPPHGQMFSAGHGLNDFVVVTVHMKSNYGGDFSAHRAREGETLVESLPRVFADPDVVIIGDFNCGSHEEPAIQAIAGAGFVDLNADDTATNWHYGPLDRAFVPADQPEFADHFFEVLSNSFFDARGVTAEAFKVTHSDHWMVITQVEVGDDDD